MFDKEKVARLQPQPPPLLLPAPKHHHGLCRLEAIHLQLRRFVSFCTRIECAPSWMELAWMAIHPSVQPTACLQVAPSRTRGEGLEAGFDSYWGKGEGIRDQHRKASGNYAYLLLSRPPSPGQAIYEHTHTHTSTHSHKHPVAPFLAATSPPPPSNHPLDYPKLDANHIRPHRSSLPLCICVCVFVLWEAVWQCGRGECTAGGCCLVLVSSSRIALTVLMNYAI